MTQLSRLSVLIALVLAGCAIPYDFGNGRHAVVRYAEYRNPFGTNVIYSQLENCKAQPSLQDELSPVTEVEYTDCQVLVPWMLSTSQGQGGQILSGALQGLGMGLGMASIPASTVTVTGGNAAASSSATAVGVIKK